MARVSKLGLVESQGRLACWVSKLSLSETKLEFGRELEEDDRRELESW